MSSWMNQIRKGYGKKLAQIHAWNGWMVLFLALSGLILLSGFWRQILGEVRVWLKWLHIGVGIALIVPVLYYLLLASKHWRQLKGKPWQQTNVIIVLALLLGWFVSGVLLWQFKAVGPAWSNSALVIHDLLTWIGLPYIIYHSITRTRWLKEPSRRTIIIENKARTVAAQKNNQPLYTRREFVRLAIGAGLTITLGPSFVKWMGSLLNPYQVNELSQYNANQLIPDPVPLPASSPPIGGGAKGNYRVYTVTDIPFFDNSNWSFTVDGLVKQKLNWNWEQFVQLKRTVQVSDFHCVTGWSVYNNTWEGIPLKQLLDQAGVDEQAKTVKFYSGDGTYTDSLTLKQARLDDVMVAVMLDGKPISSELGGPVRLIVPKMYGYKSVKWLTRIELIKEDHIGYWEQRGYDTDAWLPKNKMDI
ncbi:molybdopterin-dependent oxidoreductase [Paenibacillus sediminis]|uniref:DMSO/TMAO reductase YedYZ molybdopterin-dependent catalytic subunit n=1 Tax=Paenibacillus sediminis TaxID=664909 RepID=A0ABS4H220_9BACL|nr:molybdopterin-dependent oxidoreductase [Paenibacillus sediminis]MBP1936587.1 DMSO/TMAO reductase YedYZ molybdopterin-dependent catalytic subunit [Paenibacillus sediminis]